MNVPTLMALGMNALDEGKPDAAIEFFEVALQQDHANIEVMETYAEVLLQTKGDPERAQKLLEHAVQLSPSVGHVKYLNLAQLSSHQTALAYYQSAFGVLQTELSDAITKEEKIEVRKTLCSVRCATAELYLTDLCDEPDAEQRCEELLLDAELYNKNSIELYQTRGSLRLSQQRNAEALDCLRKAVKLSQILPEEDQPGYDSKIELGKLLMPVSPGEAFNYLLEVLQLNDENAYVWYLLGETSRLHGRHNNAARLLKHARDAIVCIGDECALQEVDQSIRSLVEAMGPDAVARVPGMGAPNPLEFLEDSDGEGGDGEEEGEEGEEEEEVEMDLD